LQHLFHEIFIKLFIFALNPAQEEAFAWKKIKKPQKKHRL